jgi:hypothetical protein
MLLEILCLVPKSFCAPWLMFIFYAYLINFYVSHTFSIVMWQCRGFKPTQAMSAEPLAPSPTSPAMAAAPLPQ